MLILLLGFMGCGKSTLGPLLALSLGLPFKDLDLEVERAVGRSITQIWADEGESGFRLREVAAFRHLKAAHRGVLALGGGLPSQPGLAEEIAQAGLAIHLELPVDALVRRLETPSRQRPLLAQVAVAERRPLIQRLYAERLPAYRRAGHTLTLGEHESVVESLDKLLARVKELAR